MTSRSRYPDYDVLDKRESGDWDDQTRDLVRRRLEHVPPIRFFTSEEARLLEAVCERIVPGSERGRRVPIVPWIDEKLFHDWRDGYRYDGVPPLREAWRLGLMGIDESARLLHGGRAFLLMRCAVV